MDNQQKKSKGNELNRLWTDLQFLQNGGFRPRIEYQSIPIGSPNKGLLGMYYTGDKDAEVQKEVAKINAENQHLKRTASEYAKKSWSNPQAINYRNAKPKRIAINFNPEDFVKQQSKKNGEMKSNLSGEDLRYAALDMEPDTFGSSVLSVKTPEQINTINPNLEYIQNWNPFLGSFENDDAGYTDTVKPNGDDGFVYNQDYIPTPKFRVRQIPITDLREMFSETEWPSVYRNWPENSVARVTYYPNTVGSQRMADYYGFKAMEDEARQEFLNTPPATMVMPRAIERPQNLYDALVAGYLPLIQQEQPAPAQRPIRYERASGHIKELKRPAQSQY